MEAFADRLKHVDNYVELRKKLNLRGRPNPNLDVPKGGAKAAGKGKDKTKEKGENAQAEAALHRTLRPMDARNPADDPTRGGAATQV